MIGRATVGLAIAAVTLAFVLPAAADAPIRHLVYDFTYGSSSDLTTQTSGIATSADSGNGSQPSAASGMSDVRTGNGDQGTITVDVTAVQPDTGLVVTISEQARNDRSATAAECIVYGNTNVICDPSAKVNAEEMVLLRLLGKNFIDPSQIDANNHWRAAHSDGDGVMTDDFTVNKNVDGVMQIGSTRVFKQFGAHITTTTSDTKITYDSNRSVPTSVSEEAITRDEQGSGNYNTTDVQTTLSLQTDSLAKS